MYNLTITNQENRTIDFYDMDPKATGGILMSIDLCSSTIFMKKFFNEIYPDEWAIGDPETRAEKGIIITITALHNGA